ncbi:hypothetical protein ANCDUO_10052 [Ancylostoma duodenale]|uniref:Uncharacterized protein n=1 Tax=Ancylostoma duodenale TaxID=51022 RepID=A0A0C2GRW4_9BILA|nr:hypothetical protein ANCDUO_10052 [Ancylostoma duodenale]
MHVSDEQPAVVIITIWEYLDSDSLFQKYLPFYVLSVDTLSLLTIVASCLRLPIYVTCQPLLRKEMIQFVFDTLSLLTIVASCLRLPIYVTCQPLLRKEMIQFVCEFSTKL